MGRFIKGLAFLLAFTAAGAFAQDTYNTRYTFTKTLTVGQTDTLYFAFPPLGGRWIPYDSTTGFNLTTKPLADDYRWSGAAALGVRLASGNTGDSAKVAVAAVSKGATAIRVDETPTYLAGSASTFSNDVLDGNSHTFTITQILDPTAAIAFIITNGDLAGGIRRWEFEFRYRR